MSDDAAARREVVIGAPVLSRAAGAAGAARAEADVDGTAVWFESADAELLPSPEAFASAFLGPALAAGRSIRVEAPLDPTWLRNVANVLPVWQRWWGYNIADAVRAVAAPAAPPSTPTDGFTASCFSGGVDSLWTLRRSPNASDVQRLLFVHGYDIPLADARRMAAWEPDLRRVAAETGRPAIVLRSNLRLHPLFRQGNWERTHGGALAAAGHVIAGMGRLIVPSSYTSDVETPWGSSHVTDAFWSGTRLRVEHDAATLSRREKIAEIADEPLAWETLRVCWEGRTPTGNCSMCEKCVRTMLVLHMRGRLDRFRVFDGSVPLPARVAGLGWLPPHLMNVYDWMLANGLRGPAARAVRRLLADNRPPSLLRRAFRKAKRGLGRLTSIGR